MPLANGIITHALYIMVLVTLVVGTGCSNAPEDEQVPNTERSQESQDGLGASGPAYWTPTFEEGKLCHWLVMTEATREEFDDDAHVTLGGIRGSLSGNVVLYVNGSPMGIYTGGINWRLEEFLEPGVNKVEVRGKHEKSISVRVATADFCNDLIGGGIKAGGFRETIAKVFVPPEQENGIVEFTVDDAKGTPLEILPQTGEKREAAEKSLRDLLGDLQHKFEKHDGKGFADLFFRNRLKLAQKLNTNIDDRQAQPVMAEVCSLPNAKLIGDLSQSKIVWGERLVLVWSGKFAEDGFGRPTDPYSFLVIIENNTTKYSDRSVISPIPFGRIDGEWVQF